MRTFGGSRGNESSRSLRRCRASATRAGSEGTWIISAIREVQPRSNAGVLFGRGSGARSRTPCTAAAGQRCPVAHGPQNRFLGPTGKCDANRVCPAKRSHQHPACHDRFSRVNAPGSTSASAPATSMNGRQHRERLVLLQTAQRSGPRCEARPGVTWRRLRARRSDRQAPCGQTVLLVTGQGIVGHGDRVPHRRR